MEGNVLPNKVDKYLVHQMKEHPILNLQILIFFSTKMNVFYFQAAENCFSS
jgi:hypothetical protein